MHWLKHYFTKLHARALIGLGLVVLGFYAYSVALLHSTPNKHDQNSFEAIHANSPEAVSEPKDTSSSYAPNNPYTYTLTESNSLTLLVNKSYRLPSGYVPVGLKVPDIATEQKSQSELSVRPETSAALEALFSAAQAEDVSLILASGYRSYSTQTTLFDSAGGEGNTLVAPPGASEHQTGLAADISGSNRACRLEACFGDNPEGQWLAAHAHEYGFVIRYPADRTADTGYSYEPWHVRFVGKNLAQTLYENNLILEEV